MWCRAASCSKRSGAPRTRASSTAWSRRCIRSGARCASRNGSTRCEESATGLSSNPELAGALHRLRSTPARMRAELELAHEDGSGPPVDRLLEDVSYALEQLGRGEADRKSTRLNSSHLVISYAVFCLKKKK